MAKKSNKEILKTVNYSFNIIKNIKSGKNFSVEEKQEILDKYTGLSEDNNSYWTPIPICNFIKNLLAIKPSKKKLKIADLSAGIGNMAIPFIKKYGQLQNNVIFDLFEFDNNTSLAGAKAWEDYKQINYYGCFDSINGDIQDNYYDFILGNPPFSGSVPCLNKYWSMTKPKKNEIMGKAKNANIADAFIDLSIKKTKNKGYVALVLPLGHLYKGNSTQKLRNWMKTQVALKAIIPFDSDTFSKAGIAGTSVGTVLIIYQKGVKQGKIFYGELNDKKELEFEMNSLASQFKIFNKNNYEVQYQSDYINGLHAVLREEKI